MIESKGHKITPIDGDLAVSRNAEIGGDADIHGKARVAGSLKIEGFLDAPNIKGAVKGLFATEEELKREYPNPRPGWCAIVLADDERGFLYLAKNRDWEKQSEEAKPFEFIADSVNVFASKDELASTEEELLKRLQGVSENSNGWREPFRRLQDVATFQELVEGVTKDGVKTQLGLNDLHGTSAAATKDYIGCFRVNVDGRPVEVFSSVEGYVTDRWSQVITAPCVLVNEVKMTEVSYNTPEPTHKYRKFTYTQKFKVLNKYDNANVIKRYARNCNGGVWSDWREVGAHYTDSPNYGKRIALFGGSFAQNMAVDSADYQFDYKGQKTNLLPYIADRLGATAFDDYAVGGQGVMAADKENGGKFDVPLIKQLQTAGAGYDVYIIMGGINDYGQNVPLGVSNSAADDTTYCGGLKKAFDWIRSNNKSAKIYTVTPFKGYDNGTNGFADRYWNPRTSIKNSDGHTFYEYIQAQKEVAQIHGVPCFDLWANQQFSGTSAWEHYLSDLLHPNGKGYQAVADVLVDFIAYGLGSGVLDAYAVLPNATDTAKGFMSAEDKRVLDKVADDIEKKQTVVQVEWVNVGNVSNMNDFTEAGVYELKGERTRDDDNLPFGNTGGSHTFHARLEVLDSSIAPEGKSDDICITQKLTLSNRVAGDGDVYIRTGRGASKEAITWETWGKLQQNIEVGQATTLDDLIDNGIYSGVLNTTGETFVLVVINNYAFAEKYGVQRSISQFKYSVNPSGVVAFGKRVKVGNGAFPESWEILNEEKIHSAIEDALLNAMNYTDKAIAKVVGTAPDTLDTLQEIAEWVNTHEDLYATLKNIADQNTVKINAEVNRAKQEENNIKAKAISTENLKFIQRSNGVALEHFTLEGDGDEITIPSATSTTAGVMSAEDKTKLENAKSSIEDLIDQVANIESDVEKEKERAEKALTDEVEKLKDGDTIVAQAREIHSRNGKNDSASFLVRTTAGSGTIGDGIAALKSVGGNIVKNIVDGTSVSKWKPASNTSRISYSNSIFSIEDIRGINYASISWDSKLDNTLRVNGHIYYYHVNINAYNSNGKDVIFGIVNMGGYYMPGAAVTINGDGWQSLSFITNASQHSDYYGCAIVDIRQDKTVPIYMSCPVVIDLTETFGETKANQMTKEECDKLFGTMDALPQGLSIANPSVFKSTGWNQFNPDMVLDGKAIVDGAIVDGDKTLAVIPCLPCKVGTGENNGYHIHGDGVDENTKVYLTPLNPREVEGELYMHELTLSEKDTYVPQIKGYMIVEVPTTANLCAHFLWSEDCDKNAYEPYYESVVELPDIPQMSEWGLAGIKANGTLICDEIDLERGVYIKRIGSVDMGTLTWVYYGNYNIYRAIVPGMRKADNAAMRLTGILTNKYPTDTEAAVNETFADKTFKRLFNNIYVRDTTYTDVTSFQSSTQGEILYYELAEPIEYPLPKVDNNYISSDYGVEQFDGGVPCNANNLYYMRSLAGETRNFLDKMYANTAKTDAKEVADYITNGIEDNKQLATNAPNLALRALFVAAGAEYNDSGVDKTKTALWGETVTHKAWHYYLNGLGDITEEQMIKIYNETISFSPVRIAPNLFAYRTFRTNMLNSTDLVFTRKDKPVDSSSLCTYSQIEVFRICSDNKTASVVAALSTLFQIFSECKKLRYVIGVIHMTGRDHFMAFSNCVSLIEIKIANISANLSFGDSPNINKNSIVYIISNAAPTTAITITLHADAYARLAEDVDIVAALAAQPLITLVSA